MNSMLAILAPVLRRAEQSTASTERKRRWRLDAEKRERERVRDRQRAALNWKLYRSNKKPA